MNTALKVLLDHQKREKAAVEKSILSNLNVLVLPYIEKMRQIASGREMKAYLDIIERNLEEITVPYTQYFSDVAVNFTPTEIQIARMILENYDTKQIARILNVSESAVSFHRKNIRRKLGLSSKKTNLSAYLRTLFRKE
jgi:DNA-binding NarL/FixJ family response regulator